MTGRARVNTAAKHPGEERLEQIVVKVIGHINSGTVDGQWLKRTALRLAQHAYDVGYDDGWAEGSTDG